MSTNIKHILENSQNFDDYLAYFKQNPKMYPTMVDKFIKILQIASERKMLNIVEEEIVKLPNFRQIVESSNSYDEIIQKYKLSLRKPLVQADSIDSESESDESDESESDESRKLNEIKDYIYKFSDNQEILKEKDEQSNGNVQEILEKLVFNIDVLLGNIIRIIYNKKIFKGTEEEYLQFLTNEL